MKKREQQSTLGRTEWFAIGCYLLLYFLSLLRACVIGGFRGIFPHSLLIWMASIVSAASVLSGEAPIGALAFSIPMFSSVLVVLVGYMIKPGMPLAFDMACFLLAGFVAFALDIAALVAECVRQKKRYDE